MKYKDNNNPPVGSNDYYRDPNNLYSTEPTYSNNIPIDSVHNDPNSSGANYPNGNQSGNQNNTKYNVGQNIQGNSYPDNQQKIDASGQIMDGYNNQGNYGLNNQGNYGQYRKGTDRPPKKSFDYNQYLRNRGRTGLLTELFYFPGMN
jgi:hypothetical protein